MVQRFYRSVCLSVCQSVCHQTDRDAQFGTIIRISVIYLGELPLPLSNGDQGENEVKR